jgi:cyanophycin synthetase
MTDISTQLLLKEIRQRGLVADYISAHSKLLKVTRKDGSYEVFSGVRPMKSAANGVRMTINKDLTLEFVKMLGYTVPDYVVVDNPDDACLFLDKHSPLVVKPIDSSKSRGVTVDIRTPGVLRAAFDEARRFSKRPYVMVQKQIVGKLYRVVVINGKVVAVTERRPSTVVGDGMRTVAELVRQENQDPRRGNGKDTPMVLIDESIAEAYVGTEKWHSTPAVGETVRVTQLDSVSGGGVAENVSVALDATWSDFFTTTAREMGLFICGFDILTDHLAEPLRERYVPLLEINSDPGLKIHTYPYMGQPIGIAGILFDELNLR